MLFDRMVVAFWLVVVGLALVWVRMLVLFLTGIDPWERFILWARDQRARRKSRRDEERKRKARQVLPPDEIREIRVAARERRAHLH